MNISDDSDEELLASINSSLTSASIKHDPCANSSRNPILTTMQIQSDSDIPQKYIDCLRREFGHRNFRGVQWSIIRSILLEARDNVAVMATGYGKSLTYQFPALYLKKVALVVSPLISLMEDQVSALNLTEERACLLGSAQSDRNIETRILRLDFNVIYSTPEYATSASGIELLRSLGDNLVLIAVDEAHCISQWGHDFRPAYRKLCSLRKVVSQPPILALTATATQQVCDEICQQLLLCQPQLIKSGFDRPNLQFIVRTKSAGLQRVWNDVQPFLRWAVDGQHGSVIIYCNTCKYAELVAAEVRQHIPCHHYHSRLALKVKKQYQQEFAHDEVRVMVATMAFGMGIDKPDVRLVIHYGAPSEMERYYQEVGRAGRDGLPSKCVLFYSSVDWSTHQHLRQNSLASNSRLQHLEDLSLKMVLYTRIMSCRRKFILEYFRDEAASELQVHKECCDNCFYQVYNMNYTSLYDGLDEHGMLDVTTDAFLLLTLLHDLQARFGISKVILILRGSRSKKLPAEYQMHPCFGKGASKSDSWFKILMENLQTQQYVCYKTKQLANGQSFSAPDITEKAKQWLMECTPNKREPIKIVAYGEILQFLKPKMIVNNNLMHNDILNNPKEVDNINKQDCVQNEELLKALLRMRSKLASEFDVMPFIIASNIALNQLTKSKPLNMDQLKCCKLDGFYEMKYDRFGAQFISTIRDFLEMSDQVSKNFTIKQEIGKHEVKQEIFFENQELQPELDKKTESLTPVKNQCIKEDPDIWGSDSECNDADLSNIADEAELYKKTERLTPVKKQCSKEVPDIWGSDSECNDADLLNIADEAELDLLIAAIEEEEKEFNESILQNNSKLVSKNVTKIESVNYLMVRPNKNSAIKYIDSDDSDDDLTLKTESTTPSPVKIAHNTPKKETPTKIRKLPSWMLDNA